MKLSFGPNITQFLTSQPYYQNDLAVITVFFCQYHSHTGYTL